MPFEVEATVIEGDVDLNKLLAESSVLIAAAHDVVLRELGVIHGVVLAVNNAMDD